LQADECEGGNRVKELCLPPSLDLTDKKLTAVETFGANYVFKTADGLTFCSSDNSLDVKTIGSQPV